MTKRIAVIGAGGCAREVAMTIRQIGAARCGYEFCGYIVSDRSKIGPHDSVAEILGDFDWLRDNRSRVDALAMGIGNTLVRAKIAAEAEQRFADVDWPVLIHPSVQIDRESAHIGKGVVICANAVVTVNVVIEPFVMIHYACTLAHECRLGRAAVLNPAAVLSGGVSVGETAMIGAGAVILQYRSVGARAIVGAGAVVTNDVRNDETVVGVPARPLSSRKLV